MVVYHLHVQTESKPRDGRFTVWENVDQNSRLVYFVPELCSPFALISYIYRKTAAKD